MTGGIKHIKMNMVELVIEIVIFTALIGTIAVQVTNPDGNITGADRIRKNLILAYPLLFTD